MIATVQVPLPEPVEGRLDDGVPVLFRPLLPTDAEGLRQAFDRLSPESRYRRFFYAIDHLSPDQVRYLTEVDHVDHFAWLAMLAEPPHDGLGIGRWIRTEDDPTSAEAAVTVIDEYHHRGLGGALLRLMAESAIARGIRSFRAQLLGENQAMLELLQGLGVAHATWHDGLGTIEVPLPASVAGLEETPAPRILRAAAAGEVVGTSGPRGVGVRLSRRSLESAPAATPEAPTGLSREEEAAPAATTGVDAGPSHRQAEPAPPPVPGIDAEAPADEPHAVPTDG